MGLYWRYSRLKELKTPEELIEIMRKNGIKFNIIKEDEAKHFLAEHNYYFKLSAYRKNYEKKVNEEGIKKYVSLEFAYLQELSTIDMLLRYIIIKMCLDIEHSLKVNLIKNIENNPNEDGYNISQIYLNNYPDVWKTIEKNKSSSYCEELIDCCTSSIPIWTLIELISFGNLVYLYKAYDDTYSNSFRRYPLLFNVKNLRNAAAHSNCLINKLQQGNAYPRGVVRQFVTNIDGIGNAMIRTKLSNRAICDFITMLYVFNDVVNSENIKKHRYKELNDLFNKRMVKNKEYFKDNECIKTSYKFCKKVVDKLYNSAYNEFIN